MIYLLQYRKKTEPDPDKWFTRCKCPEKWQVEKFMGILETTSNVYAELRIVPVTEQEQ